VLTPPDDLPDEALLDTVDRAWGVSGGSVEYRPVGFGSHHWELRAGDARWFLNADELEVKRHTAGELLEAAYGRLRAALAAACDLRAHGRPFVVAPLPARDGEPLVRVGRFGVALYPFVDGRGFDWGLFDDPEHRDAMLRMVVGVHTAPAEARRRARAEDFAVPYRDELEAALAGSASDHRPDHGPYARAMADLIAAHARPLRALLDRYDALVAEARARPGPAVLTHGEPHAGNTMRGPAGWFLIDWDTALVAPPERDLWTLDPGDGSVLSAYAAATGVEPAADMLELYRVLWGVKDIAVDVARFRRPHTGSADDDKSWGILSALVTDLG
jgi:spectinomycin phosphotransferase/16S rRNA (guanine(1405)-N(7))-methyltransferase